MKLFTKFVFLTALAVLVLAGDVLSQVPQAFGYQAVARDADGSIVANTEISVQVRVLRGSETGDVVYTESHTVTTSAVGSFTLQIGEGVPQGSSFASVDWLAGTHYLALGVDLSGGTDFIDMGATRVLSVPYALVSQRSVEAPLADFPSRVDLNMDQGDTTLVVALTGTGDGTAVRFESAATGSNRGVLGLANTTDASNSNSQFGVMGRADGVSAGSQFGVLGSSVNLDAQGNTFRYGVYGQSGSKYRENIGVFGIGLGEGTGQIVLPGEEVDNFIGSINAGGIFWSTGNLNYNIGVRGRVYGASGARAGVAVQATSEATATGINIGVESITRNSQTTNVGFQAIVDDNRTSSANNFGMRLFVNRNGARSIGVEVHADTALYVHGKSVAFGDAVWNGNVQVNGDFAYTGTISNTSDLHLKQGIRSIDNGLGIIMQLRPTAYTFRGNGQFNGLQLAKGQRYGLIAQEVAEVLPELVTRNTHRYMAEVSDGEGVSPGEGRLVETEMEYLTLNYTEMIPFLIRAIQEQQAELEQQRSEIRDLQQRMDALMQRN